MIATNSWPQRAAGEVLRPVYRSVEVFPDQAYRLLGAHWYSQGLYVKDELSGGDIRASLLYKVIAGDFVYNRLFAWKGAFALAEASHDGCFVSGEFPVFVVDQSRVDPSWLRYYFTQEMVWSQALGLSSGSTPTSRNRLKEAQFLAMMIPLPPLDEQRRIVTRLKGVDLKVEQVIRLRAVAMVATTAAEDSALSRTFESLCARHGARPMAELLIDAGYGTSAKCSPERQEGSVPVLRIPNVASERIRFEDMKFAVLEAAEVENVGLAENDLLVVRTNGSIDLVGRSAVVASLQEPTAFASYLIRLRCNSNLVDPHFLQLMMKHLRRSGQLIGFARTTAGQYNVSLGRLREARVPVPPLKDQGEIVSYFTRVNESLSSARALQGESQEELDALLPAVLHQAFQGAL